VAKKPESSRVPSLVGAIPVVGDLAKSADAQAKWLQELVEQNARLVGQFPATMKTFNDSLERFNQTVGRLDRAVTRIEAATKGVIGPLERLSALDSKALKDLPDLLETLRKEAVPALRAATDTQRQVALLQGTMERVVGILGEFPGAGIVRRMAGGTRAGDDAPPPGRPRPAAPREQEK
jgi:ABC-type transporter Mla subunit MlaD